MLSHKWGYYGVLPIHTPDAIGVGVRPEAIQALWEGREEDLTDREQLLTKYIRAVIDGTVDDETWNALQADIGTRGLIELSMFICHLGRVLRTFQAFGIPEPTLEEVRTMNREFADGTRKAPDYAEAQRVGALGTGGSR